MTRWMNGKQVAKSRLTIAADLLGGGYGDRKQWEKNYNAVLGVASFAASDPRPGTYVQRLVRAVKEMKR